MMHLPLRTLATASPARISSALSAWMHHMGVTVAMGTMNVHMDIHSVPTTRRVSDPYAKVKP